MKQWQSRLFLAFAVMAMASACSKTPGSPSVSFTAPVGAQPSNGSTFKFNAQPVTITITNATKTGDAVVTYSVEVASDSGFANKVFTKDAIPEGSNGTTTVQITNLPGAATYFWHSKSVIDGVTSAPSVTQTFNVMQQVIVSPPTPVEPASGGTASVARPTFTVNNAARTGPAGAITYEFQVSTSASFSPITSTATIPEQATRTSWTPPTDLPETTLFWRVQAKDDSNSVISGFGGGTTFSIKLFDINQVIWVNNPNLAKWTQNANITSIDFSTGYVLVDFDRRTGPNQWPGVPFGGGSNDPLQYTLGMCFNLGGKWHCSAAIQFWPGRDLDASGPARFIADDWYYDSRWGAMAGHQPAIGEQVGIFVAAGNVRDSLSWAVEQRSDIVLTPFGTNYVKK